MYTVNDTNIKNHTTLIYNLSEKQTMELEYSVSRLPLGKINKCVVAFAANISPRLSDIPTWALGWWWWWEWCSFPRQNELMFWQTYEMTFCFIFFFIISVRLSSKVAKVNIDETLIKKMNKRFLKDDMSTDRKWTLDTSNQTNFLVKLCLSLAPKAKATASDPDRILKSSGQLWFLL